jgi:hypothetical protein
MPERKRTPRYGGPVSSAAGTADGALATDTPPTPWVCSNPVSGRRVIAVSALAVAGLVCGCGGTEQGAAAPQRNFPVAVLGSFPVKQRLAQRTSFTVRVKNVGSRTIPNVAVTVLNPRYGTAAQAFGRLIPPGGPGQPILASRSRPVWIINRAPGRCRYGCRNRGPGGAATAYSNTWALGPLAPGHSVAFRWRLTAVVAGPYTVVYEVAAELDGHARAVLRNGAPARGRFNVSISPVPPRVTVQSDGQVTQKT